MEDISLDRIRCRFRVHGEGITAGSKQAKLLPVAGFELTNIEGKGSMSEL